MRSLRAFLLLLSALLALVGCGGGGSSRATSRGTATIRIVWPNASRAIPANAAFVVVSLTRGADLIVKRTLAKSSATSDPEIGTQAVSSATFGSLDPGTYTVIAEAFAGGGEPNGAALAKGTSVLSVFAGVDTKFVVTMDSTLVRYKITETPTDGTLAFFDNANPAPASRYEFYLDTNGAHAEPEGGAPVKFNALSTAATITITPQSSVGDLMLVNASVPNLIKMTVGGGFSLTNAITQAVAGSMILRYTPSSTTTGTLRVDYSDYQDGVLTPLSSYSGDVALLSAPVSPEFTIGGLPDRYSALVPSPYLLTGSLKEADVAGSAGATYTATADPVTASNKLTFENVADRGREFTLVVRLQVKAVGGGYVDLTSARTSESRPLRRLSPSLSFVGDDYKAVEILAPSTTVNALVFRRGDPGTVTEVGVRIDGTELALDPSLFDWTLPSSPLLGRIVQTSARPWTLRAGSEALSGRTVTNDVPLSLRLGGRTVNGVFRVVLLPNAGNLPVGVN